LPRHYRGGGSRHLFCIEAGHRARPEMENSMKTMILAAFATLSLTAAVAPAAHAALGLPHNAYQTEAYGNSGQGNQ
jgi:hypothetical protein